MPFEYLEDIAIADVAFRAWGKTIEEMFIAAVDACMNVMVEELFTIRSVKSRTINLKTDSIDMLLFDFVQEFIYYKDAEQLLLRVGSLSISKESNGGSISYALTAEAVGEEIDPVKHHMNVDVKAVTLHRFEVIETEKGWEAAMILDI